MAEEKLLTVREVSIILSVSEKDVIEMVETGLLPAYKVGGVYLRFKRLQIEEFKKKSRPEGHKAKTYSLKEKVSDFFYFNDFYILALVIILLLLIVIFQT
jgi:excisionase family DNA binding protein